ncbi:MAG TPA: PDZ domain-containing protein [Anaerolineales bacterium]|nr:PDZ domain-containing protein [Anaerolineales bacterium]
MAKKAVSEVVLAQRTIPASPQFIFDYFVNNQNLRHWLCDYAMVEPHVNGRVMLRWNEGGEIYGKFKEYNRPNRIVISLPKGAIEVDLLDTVDGTRITVQRTGATDPDRTLREWNDALETLATILDSGLDLRRLRSPMLGFYAEPITAEAARSSGKADQDGLDLQMIFADSPAANAGLQANDVLIAVDGKRLHSMEDLGAVLRAKEAGDLVHLQFVRHLETHETTAILQARTAPQIPPSKEALYAKIKHLNDDSMWLLAEAVDGISEAQARHQPAPNEWSVSQVVAHLILTEWNESDTAVLIARGEAPNESFWVGQDSLRLQSVIDGARNLDGLLQTLRQAHRAKEALILHVPEQILQYRDRWASFCYAISDEVGHNSIHLDQIRACIRIAQREVA